MLLLTGGMERTEAEYRSLLNRAGFELTKTITTSSGADLLEATPT